MSPSRTRGGIRNAAGGWPKSVDFAAAPTPQPLADAVSGGRANSLDNDATTVPMQFLARVAQATGDEQYRRSFVRGLDYLMEAQYPNGGWPQFIPLHEGYYSHITFNDGAMIHALTLLRDVAAGEPPYDFADADRRATAAAAVAKGVDCILRTQIKQDGKLTVWCAQHDEITLAPTSARRYEVPSLSGAESVGIVHATRPPARSGRDSTNWGRIAQSSSDATRSCGIRWATSSESGAAATPTTATGLNPCCRTSIRDGQRNTEWSPHDLRRDRLLPATECVRRPRPRDTLSRLRIRPSARPTARVPRLGVRHPSLVRRPHLITGGQGLYPYRRDPCVAEAFVMVRPRPEGGMPW